MLVFLEEKAMEQKQGSQRGSEAENEKAVLK